MEFRRENVPTKKISHDAKQGETMSCWALQNARPSCTTATWAQRKKTPLLDTASALTALTTKNIKTLLIVFPHLLLVAFRLAALDECRELLQVHQHQLLLRAAHVARQAKQTDDLEHTEMSYVTDAAVSFLLLLRILAKSDQQLIQALLRSRLRNQRLRKSLFKSGSALRRKA